MNEIGNVSTFLQKASSSSQFEGNDILIPYGQYGYNKCTRSEQHYLHSPPVKSPTVFLASMINDTSSEYEHSIPTIPPPPQPIIDTNHRTSLFPL